MTFLKAIKKLTNSTVNHKMGMQKRKKSTHINISTTVRRGLSGSIRSCKSFGVPPQRRHAIFRSFMSIQLQVSNNKATIGSKVDHKWIFHSKLNTILSDNNRKENRLFSNFITLMNYWGIETRHLYFLGLVHTCRQNSRLSIDKSPLLSADIMGRMLKPSLMWFFLKEFLKEYFKEISVC